MKLHELTAVPGSTTVGKRKGRGIGTGNGKTAGRGHKGQKARSGGTVATNFEGGQMRLTQRIPKRGFNNIFAKNIVCVNLNVFNRFNDGDVVNAEKLMEIGAIKQYAGALKVLANGNLQKKVTIQATAFSQGAKEKIEAAGGKTEVV